MIDIYLLQQLAGFAEYGTLSAASRQLHTSQPAMTRAMKKLEGELGVALFQRTKNRMELNETGRYAAKYARRILDESQDFEANIRAFDRSLHTISIGFCAPVPQTELTPMLNRLFEGMTISADMMDDSDFLARIENGTYQLAVTHYQPEDEKFYSKKCGHEDLLLSVDPGDPLAFCPEIHLSDLDGLSVLLLSQIGFWADTHRKKTPNTNYLLQVEPDSFLELITHSNYPHFTSSHYVRRGEALAGRVNVPIADPECHADYYLVCLAEDAQNYEALFGHITENTVL